MRKSTRILKVMRLCKRTNKFKFGQRSSWNQEYDNNVQITKFSKLGSKAEKLDSILHICQMKKEELDDSNTSDIHPSKHVPTSPPTHFENPKVNPVPQPFTFIISGNYSYII